MKNFYYLLNLLFILLPNTASTFLINSSTSTQSQSASSISYNGNQFVSTEAPIPNNHGSLLCHYGHDNGDGKRDHRLQCCKKTADDYHESWLINSLPLNRYLAFLKHWNCSQLQDECEQRLFNYSPFTDLMYDYFCDYATFVSKCLPNVTDIVKTISTTDDIPKAPPVKATDFNNSLSTHVETLRWNYVISLIQPSMMTIDELLEPCIQVAQYDQEEIHDGSYQEVIDFAIPSCGISWCGFGQDALKSHHISVWTCLPSRCRARTVVIMVACGILGFAIVVVNVLIILVIALNTRLKNSQAVYKLSLAVADLLVGAFVLPVCIVTLSRLVWTRHELPADPDMIEGYQLIDGNISENVTVMKVEGLAGEFYTKFPSRYVNFAGFFMAISIFVSVFTLAGAGFDRLNAIAKPFTYKKRTSYNTAVRACLGFWIVAIIFGLLPIFIPDLKYVLILSIVFATLDVNGYILYSVSFFIPFVIVWIVNILTFVHSRKHSNFRRSLTQTALKKRQKVERRLASTLRLMVGTFTFNTLPLLLTLICSFFIPTVLPNLPQYFNVDDAKIFLTVQLIAVFLLFGNSLCNFFIYSVRNREFRGALKPSCKKIAIATSLSFCLNSTSLCCHDIKRKSSNPFTTISSAVLRRRSTAATLSSKIDSNCGTDESSVFTGTASSVTNTPNLNNQRRNRHDGTATELNGNRTAAAKRQQYRFSRNLESLDEDLIFGASAAPTRDSALSLSVMNGIDESDGQISKSADDSL